MITTLRAFALFLLLPQSFSLNNVFNYINKHKNLINSSVLVLNKTILQQKYVFVNNVTERTVDDVLNGLVLNVGFSRNCDVDFDCGFEEKRGYSWEILENLQQMLSFK